MADSRCLRQRQVLKTPEHMDESRTIGHGAVQAFPWNVQLPPWERAPRGQYAASQDGMEHATCAICSQPLSPEDRGITGL